MSPRHLGLLALLAGCVVPRELQEQLDATEKVIEASHRLHAMECAPRELALAESSVAFTRVEFEQGFPRRASEHLAEAAVAAKLALERSDPCGTLDRDGDGIADVVDRCPDDPEDIDGDRDEDGCRDVDPYGDEDRDGIRNIDDDCIDEPEDFDGHNDEDGCPETSDDSDGDGIIDALDQCPNAAEDLDGFKDPDGCPDPDNDLDGIVDLRDACPNVAEDKDLWEDEDGCPDPDNDLDGVADTFDRCPNEPGDRDNEGCPTADADQDGIADSRDACPDQPETMNNYLDEDGCPDTPPTRVQVTRTQVEIRETIQFATGSSNLLSSAYPILDDVVQVLHDAPNMRLRIEGHTDSQGGDDFNLELSQDRALAVQRYLESKGIDTSRLSSQGFGETRPIDTNRTDSGRARNRRVEFHIVE